MKTLTYLQRALRVSIFMNISDMTTFNPNIRDIEVIESIHQDINTANHRDMIRRTTMHENINHKNINHAIISINQITRANQFLLLYLISIQYHRTTLTEIRDHFSIQIKRQTTTNINHDLIYSEILYSRMIHRLIKFVRIEVRDLFNFGLDRMNSIDETKNTKTRFIIQRQRSLI